VGGGEKHPRRRDEAVRKTLGAEEGASPPKQGFLLEGSGRCSSSVLRRRSGREIPHAEVESGWSHSRASHHNQSFFVFCLYLQLPTSNFHFRHISTHHQRVESTCTVVSPRFLFPRKAIKGCHATSRWVYNMAFPRISCKCGSIVMIASRTFGTIFHGIILTDMLARLVRVYWTRFWPASLVSSSDKIKSRPLGGWTVPSQWEGSQPLSCVYVLDWWRSCQAFAYSCFQYQPLP
jgi:hypothetical protein